MKRIALCVIATGKYDRFVPPLLESAKRFFCVNHDVRFNVFSDNTALATYLTDHLPWPLPTLMRYHRMSEVNIEADYIFYIDADMEFVRPVGDEILSPLVAVQHPGFFGRPRGHFTYCLAPASRAFVRPDEGTVYYAGGFQGGSKATYGAAVRHLRGAIAADIKDHIIATWHDESHWNRYLIDNPPTVTLSPDYCSTPHMRHDTRKVVALDKNHAEMRS